MNGAITSGGSCRSMSIGIRTSPRAFSMPAVIAASLPKLRERLTTRTRLSRSLRSSRCANVSSREPSLTKTNSKRNPVGASTETTVSMKRSMDSSSLKTGTIRDSSGVLVRRRRCAASWRSSAVTWTGRLGGHRENRARARSVRPGGTAGFLEGDLALLRQTALGVGDPRGQGAIGLAAGMDREGARRQTPARARGTRRSWASKWGWNGAPVPSAMCPSAGRARSGRDSPRYPVT